MPHQPRPARLLPAALANPRNAHAPSSAHSAFKYPTVLPATVRSRNSPAAAAAAPLLQTCTQCRKPGMRGAKSLLLLRAAERGGSQTWPQLTSVPA